MTEHQSPSAPHQIQPSISDDIGGEKTSTSNDTTASIARFTLELEFVSALASPSYLNHLAAQKYFDSPEFVSYLSYLRYWSKPEYARYLLYPGPTLKALELLQQDKFRRDILMPETMARVAEGWVAEATAARG